MEKCLLFSVVVIILVAVVSAQNVKCGAKPNKVVVCYYSSWSKYRPELGEFTIDHIDPCKCTHIIYTFAGLDAGSGVMSLDYGQDVDLGMYKKFTALKEINPWVKTILAIGGWNEGSRKYSVMAEQAESRSRFVESVLRFVVHYDFDGFDFDWEYPGQRGGLPEDKANFATLLGMLKERLHKWDLSLSVAVPMSLASMEQSYDFAAIAEHADFVHIMAYDYTSSSSPTTGLNAPLSAVKSSVDAWLKYIPASKLVLGLASYGRSFTLSSANQNSVGSKSDGPGVPGEFTLEAGFLSYYEVLDKLNSGRYQMKSQDGTNYAYYGTDWFSYDDEYTYVDKIQYALSKNLGGMMVWSIDTDDFDGIFQDGGKYPILNVIHDLIN